jgi:hypothetical protein
MIQLPNSAELEKHEKNCCNLDPDLFPFFLHSASTCPAVSYFPTCLNVHGNANLVAGFYSNLNPNCPANRDPAPYLHPDPCACSSHYNQRSFPFFRSRES